MDSAEQNRNLVFGPMYLAFSSVPVNGNRFLTIIGTVLDGVRGTELCLLLGLEEEGVRVDLVARDRGVATVRGDKAGLRGRLLARQRVRALDI